MEKTTYVKKAEVEKSMALPKTLQAETQMTPMGGAEIAMFPVYGRDMAEKRVWCATFVDRDEAQAWIHACKAFGRAVIGAVIADQAPAESKQMEMDYGTGTDSGEPAKKPD